MMKAKSNVSVVALGKTGHTKADVTKKHPKLNLFAFCDVMESKGNHFSECDFFLDYNDLLKKSEDASFVCIHNPNIPEIAVAVLQKGIYVLCKNPTWLEPQ